MRPSIMLAIVATCVFLVPAPAAAIPPAVSLGHVNVDGHYFWDWDLNVDFFANMYRAGDPAKPLESKLYLKYDCSTMTMYALVLCEPGVVGYIVQPDGINPDTTTAWIALNTSNNKVVNEDADNNGIPPDFAWVERGYDGDLWHAQGYEASFPLVGDGTTHYIFVQIDVWDDGAQQTSRVINGLQVTVPDCSVGTESTTWGAIKGLYR